VNGPPEFRHAADDAYAYARRARDLAESTTHLGHDTGCTLAYRRIAGMADAAVEDYRALERSPVRPPVEVSIYRHRVCEAETMLRQARKLMGDKS
jgi:hypothetical protein